MANWTIGDVKITRIVEIELALPLGGEDSVVTKAYPEALQKIDWLQPHFATPEGHAKFAIQALLIETPTKRIIVDTCIGNEKKNRANAFFNDMQTPFLKHMEDAGWPRESVDVVLCTHLHVDHVGWNTMLDGDKWVPTFPNARYLIGAREWAHWQTEGDAGSEAVLGDSVQPIFDAGLADLVNDTHRITPEVYIRPTPGHTPGHISVVISSKGETAVITGDLMHHPSQIANPDWSSGFDHNQSQANVTRAAFIAEMAGSGMLVIGTHFATPAAGHVVKDGTGYKLKV